MSERKTEKSTFFIEFMLTIIILMLLCHGIGSMASRGRLENRSEQILELLEKLDK